ncbi:MAG TPA: homoserine dehydrogenase [Acidobacteriota bacterium]|nr:homoserine dehydrogenase [Acidobacteriota bacterium]
MRILLLGLGAVAGRMLEMLGPRRPEFPGLDGLDVEVAAVFTRRHGCWCPERPEPVEGVLRARARGEWLKARDQGDLKRFIADGPYDVLVELTTLSVEGQGRPAADYVRWALEAGRHVVTANKGPMAFQGSSLRRLARRRGRLFRYESAVMDGAPVFSLARCGLRGCQVQSFQGILNSTTNFILCALEQGRSFEDALRQARKEGFAEADPAHDLQGWDAACKVSVLANALMEADLHPFSVRRQGLEPSLVQRVRRVFRRGERLRLVCRAERRNGEVVGEVGLQRLSADDELARVRGAGGLLRLETDAMGPILIVQQAPTLDDTAYGVLNDLMEIASTTGS